MLAARSPVFDSMLYGDFAEAQQSIVDVLRAWAEAKENSNCAESEESSRQDRKRAASELTRHIAFEHIDPETLSTTVKASGLVTMGQLCEAYESQALSAKQHGFSCKKMRFAGWKTSNDVHFSSKNNGMYSTDVLQCPALTFGVHKWSILVEEMTVSLHLGVTSTVHTLNCNEFPGRQSGGWVYGFNGGAYHNTSQNSSGHPTFKKGSKVTFILDLTGEGTLSSSVDGTPAVQVFSNMLSKSKGFVPAVSCYGTGAVRFLGFE
jgi:hypothetical protein